MNSPKHLNALRAFEATARLGSFKAAADEIGVTPEAVGQLVRSLEAYLCLLLFHRNQGGKRLNLTQEALSVMPELADSLRRLSAVIDRLKGFAKSNIITLTSSPSISAKWLVPLLPVYLSENSDVDIRLEMTDRVLDLSMGEADVVIRYADCISENLNSSCLLHDEKLLPVCSAKLLARFADADDVHALVNQTLIHDNTMTNPKYPGWAEWFNQMGVLHWNNAHQLQVNASLSVIEMAKLGQGVALVREHLVASELASGELVKLFEGSEISTHWHYYLVTSKQPKPQIAAFTQWLHQSLSQ